MADIAELIVALKLRDGLSGGLGRLNGQLKGMKGGLSDVGRGIGQVGRGLDTVVTRGAIAAAGGLAAVVTTAASFEQAFTGVEKTVDGTEAQLGELEETLRGMARTMPITFEELASIGEQGGALGIARQDLDEFVDVVARLAVSTDLSSEAAATSLGKLGTILHLSGNDFEDLADSLVALGNAGGSTESEIVEVAQRFAAAGNAAGLTKEEILALASATTSMGVEIEAAGSSLSRIFNSVATNIGTSSDKAVAFADTLGLSAGEFRKAWEKDALGTFQDFLGELSKLDQFEQANVLQQIGITGVRDVNAVRLMTQNLGFFGAQLETSADAQRALRTESDKFFGTTTGGFQTLKNIGRDSLATIGEGLLPVVNEEIKELGERLNDPQVRAGLEAFGKDLAEGIRGFLKEVKSADFGPLLDTMKGAAAIAKTAFDAFRSLPQPIQQLALAAIVANKVTGGAVGGIAAGLGNILKGTIKIAFPKVFDRGSSPANPMFVSAVGGGIGSPGGTAGRGGGAGNLLGVGALSLIGLPLLANELGNAINEASGVSQEELQEAVDNSWWGVATAANTEKIAKAAEEERAARPPGADAESADTTLLREFGGRLDKLATKEVIERLSNTTEIGLEGIGTSMQVGLTTGLDPVGDLATRILRQAENPKAPEVMHEIQGHLAGLEEIQATYLAQGDVTLAQKVQANIDTLQELIGATDLHRQVTQYLSDQAASSDAAMLATAQNQTGQLQTQTGQLSYANSLLAGINAKNFSPTIVNRIAFSATVLQNQIVQAATVSGSRIPGVQTPY